MNPQLEKNFKYHSPKEGQPEKYTAIREKAKELAYLIDESCPNSREKSLAITKIEEASMWANASIARNEWKEVLPDMSRLLIKSETTVYFKDGKIIIYTPKETDFVIYNEECVKCIVVSKKTQK